MTDAIAKSGSLKYKTYEISSKTTLYISLYEIGDANVLFATLAPSYEYDNYVLCTTNRIRKREYDEDEGRYHTVQDGWEIRFYAYGNNGFGPAFMLSSVTGTCYVWYI